MLQLRTVNRIFKEDGLPIELVKGDGYFYFIYDYQDGNRLVYDSHSVYTYRLNNLPLERWVEDGRRFALETEHHFGVYPDRDAIRIR